MGGVDLSDQLLQYYQTRRQTHNKYWKTFFYHCIDICVTNAYIVYIIALPDTDKLKLKHEHKQFVASLINELADAGSVVTKLSPGQGIRSQHVRAIHHLEYYNSGRKYYVMCKKFQRNRLTDKYLC